MAQYVDEMAKKLDKIDEQKDCYLVPRLAFVIPLHNYTMKTTQHALWRNEFSRCPHQGVRSILVLNTSNVSKGVQSILAPNLLATSRGWWNRWWLSGIPTPRCSTSLWLFRKPAVAFKLQRLLGCMLHMNSESLVLTLVTFNFNPKGFHHTRSPWYLPTVLQEGQKEELRNIYIECTKADVRVNNMMSRVRPFYPWTSHSNFRFWTN